MKSVQTLFVAAMAVFVVVLLYRSVSFPWIAGDRPRDEGYGRMLSVFRSNDPPTLIVPSSMLVTSI